jgi:hypothetical protein
MNRAPVEDCHQKLVTLGSAGASSEIVAPPPEASTYSLFTASSGAVGATSFNGPVMVSPPFLTAPVTLSTGSVPVMLAKSKASFLMPRGSYVCAKDAVLKSLIPETLIL